MQGCFGQPWLLKVRSKLQVTALNCDMLLPQSCSASCLPNNPGVAPLLPCLNYRMLNWQLCKQDATSSGTVRFANGVSHRLPPGSTISPRYAAKLFLSTCSSSM